jgi:hypothetical protein
MLSVSLGSIWFQLIAFDVSLCVRLQALCHRKDGTTYWNHIRIFQAPTSTSHNPAGPQHWIVQVRASSNHQSTP